MYSMSKAINYYYYSLCNYYNISEENMQVILDGTGNIAKIQVV